MPLSWVRHRATTARPALRLWRRTRPFWGGLLLVLAGLELIALPLFGVLSHGAVRLVIYIGIGGVFGVLIGVLLIACGVIAWVNPAHRQFYGIAGVVLGILSFPASNLGGFVIGMLLGIAGGSLTFAWAPLPQPAASPAAHKDRMLGVAVMPAVLAAGLLAAPAVHASGAAGAAQAAVTSRTAPAGPAELCIFFICIPSPPAPSPPAPSPSPTPTLPGLPGLPGPAPSPSPSASPGASKTAAPPGLTAATATAVITAGSAELDDFAYQGAATVPTAHGSQAMMKFTASSLTLAGGVKATVTQGGVTTTTTSPSLDFSGGVVLYATQLSGCLGQLCVTLTPASVVALLLKLIGPATSGASLTLTSVTTDQPLVTAVSLQAGGLSISLG